MKVLDDASYVKDDPVRPSLSYAFRKFKGELKFEAFTQIGFSGTSAFMQYSEFISRK